MLRSTDGLAGVGADNAIGGARVVVFGTEQCLQLDALAATQGQIVFWPAASNVARAIETLTEQADGQGIGRRVVVPEDRAEVIQHQERWTAITGGQQQGSRKLLTTGWQAYSGR
ncbi:hypothetical protein D3C72_1448990 [compost metagenome]